MICQSVCPQLAFYGSRVYWSAYGAKMRSSSSPGKPFYTAVSNETIRHRSTPPHTQLSQKVPFKNPAATTSLACLLGRYLHHHAASLCRFAGTERDETAPGRVKDTFCSGRSRPPLHWADSASPSLLSRHLRFPLSLQGPPPSWAWVLPSYWGSAMPQTPGSHTD